MKFGFCVMANIDEIGFFSHAETLGYDSVWVADSQMLFSDLYAVLALAARQTSRLRIGPGTAICGTRIPPVQVAAMATLNRMAPGRVFLGIGTGNTAMRTMGQRPMKMAAFEEYLRVLSALLDGQVVDYAFEGRPHPVKMLMHETRYMNLLPRVPLYSDRVKQAVGPNVMASVYYFYDTVQERGIDPPAFLERIWKPYCALVEQTPAEHRHFRTHEFHYTALHPGEAELIDEQLIRDTCLVGTADELIAQIRTLEQDGLQELIFATGTGAKWRLAEDFSREVMARL